MEIPKLRAYINSVNKESIFLNNPAFDGSVVGITSTGNIIYNCTLMKNEYLTEHIEATEVIAETVIADTIANVDRQVASSPLFIDNDAEDVIIQLKYEFLKNNIDKY